MGRIATGALWLALACCLGAHSGAARKTNKHIPSEDRFNFFDLELLQSIAQAQEGNVVVSPVSVKATLTMLLEGAGGETAAQLRTALRLPEHQTGVQGVMKAYLSSLLVPNSGYKLDLGNQVFMSRMLKPNPSYVNTLRNNYYAGVTKVDFSQREETARNINMWIKQLTRGLIPTLVDADSLQPDSQVMVANAVYFKGKWKIPFDRSGTGRRSFYPLPGQCRDVNMMDGLAYYNYAYLGALDAYALELPYEGDKFSMLVVLPKTRDGIAQLVRDIAHERMHNIVGALAMTEVVVSMPRFDIELSNDLVSTLTALGVVDLFTPQSNLTGLFEGAEATAQVSNVFHKAKIIVNEEGSEAGAGTGALVIPLMGGSVMPKFLADHPFLFFIRDVTTGVLVFAGRVNEPEAAAESEHYQGNVDAAFGQPPAATTTRRPGNNRRSSKRPATQPPPTTQGTFSLSQNAAGPPKQQQRPQSSQYPAGGAQKPSYSQVAGAQVPSGAQNLTPRPHPQGGGGQSFELSNPPSPSSPALQYQPSQHQLSQHQLSQQHLSQQQLSQHQQTQHQQSQHQPSQQHLSQQHLSQQHLSQQQLSQQQQSQHQQSQHQPSREQIANPTADPQPWNGDPSRSPLRQNAHSDALPLAIFYPEQNAANNAPRQQAPHSQQNANHPPQGQQQGNGQNMHTRNAGPTRTNTEIRHTNTDQDTNKQHQVNGVPQYAYAQNTQNTLTDARILNANTRNSAPGQVSQSVYTQNPGSDLPQQRYHPQQDRRENGQLSKNFQQPSAQPLLKHYPVQYNPTAVPAPTNNFIPSNNGQFQSPFQADGRQQYPTTSGNVEIHVLKSVGYTQNNPDAIRYEDRQQDRN